MASGNVATLTLKIITDAQDAVKGLDETASSASKFSGGVKAAAVPAAAALAAVGAAGLDMAKAAAEDQAAADQLALALRNSAGASDASIAATETWISNTSKAAAVADDELRPALATLVRATGDVQGSQEAMNTALDVSAATGKDVGSVSDALAKAYAGNTTSLGKMVPGMDKAILASGDMDAIMGELARTTGGAAATAAESAAGQMEGMSIQMGEAKEAIGAALLPALTSLTGMLAESAEWVQENSQLFLILGGAIAGIAASILILNVAMKAYQVISKAVSAATKIWTGIQWLLNASFWANPIFLIIAGVLLLIGAIVLIATKTTWFQDIWETVWGAIQTAAAAVWEWLVNIASTVWETIVTIVQTYINIYIAIIQGIINAVQAVWDWIVNAAEVVWQTIVAIVQTYIDIYVRIFEGIKAGIGAVWDWLSNIARTTFDAVTGFVSNAIAGWVRIFEGIKSSIGAVWDWLSTTASDVLDGILTPVEAIKKAFDKVVDAIKSVIDWLSKIQIPKALSDAAGAIGGILGLSAAPPAAASSGTVGLVAPRGLSTFAAPTLTASAGSRSNDAPTIVIQGALDPVAVARQIREILKRDDRRRQGVRIA